jgi:site-specific DNA-methyltransferase (adenine-specific)
MEQHLRNLYYGDNLDVMRSHIKDESIDLIYLDPPFNSNQEYNVSFGSDSQIQAFNDTWQWCEETAETLSEIRQLAPKLCEILETFHSILGSISLSAYLIMMGARILEFKRVLKPTGSLYLHCDPTACHYIKIILDAIFGINNFRHQLIWKRTSAHNDSKGWGHIQDNILFYTKSNNYTWNKIYTQYDEQYLSKFYKFKDNHGRIFRLSDLTAKGITKSGDSIKPWKGVDPTKNGRHWAIPRSLLNDPNLPESTIEALDYMDSKGRIFWPPKGTVPSCIRYLDEMPGAPIQEIITDIPPLSSDSKEKLGYPTQKPLALLERIIQASSKPNDVVLDPFCGCGTAIEAAEKHERQWICIDITFLAINLVEQRIRSGARTLDDSSIKIIGIPKDLESAKALAVKDKFQFQFWAVSLLSARPREESKKDGDKGIDGVILFNDEGVHAKSKKIIISVKGGDHVNPSMIRDLRGVMERENAPMGIFLTLAKPSKQMLEEAHKAGRYIPPIEKAGESHPGVPKESYPRIQIVTIEDLFEGRKPKIPIDIKQGGDTFKKNRAIPSFQTLKKDPPLFPSAPRN